MKRRLATFAVLLLASCGYHLVGQGGGAGAIPEDVATLSVEAAGESAQAFVADLKRQLANSRHYSMVDAKAAVDEASHAVLRIEQASESFVPSAYDSTGIATQYRMTLRGTLRLYRSGELVWDSGSVAKSGDVFVTGGPTGVESSRQRIRDDLRDEWVSTLRDRINAGF